jgi:L-fucose isomerase-like protein
MIDGRISMTIGTNIGRTIGGVPLFLSAPPCWGWLGLNNKNNFCFVLTQLNDAGSISVALATNYIDLYKKELKY